MDRDERRLDLLEAGARVVVRRGLERVELVVRVTRAQPARDVIVDLLVGLRERRRPALPEDRVAAHEPEHLRRAPRALWLFRVISSPPLGIAPDPVHPESTPDG